MIVCEFKVKGKKHQYKAIDEAIRTSQFVRNKCLRYWMDGQKVNRAELYRYNTKLRSEFSFVEALNSHATQASVERCWSSIARFFDNCKKQNPVKKGYPRFKKNTRSVEYKTSGWKLLDPKHIEFTDKKGIGKLKLIGTWDLAFYPQDKINGAVVKKSLSTRTHICACGCRLDRDENAAINILNRALGTVGHTGTWILDPNASGDLSSTFVGAILH